LTVAGLYNFEFNADYESVSLKDFSKILGKLDKLGKLGILEFSLFLLLVEFILFSEEYYISSRLLGVIIFFSDLGLIIAGLFVDFYVLF
jgi:hypothetical protein